PDSTPEAAAARDQAMLGAELEAARVPLETAEACLEVLKLAQQAARNGNIQAVTDAGVAGLLAAAAAEGALLNVQINLKSIPGNADKDDIQRGLQRLREALGPEAQRCSEIVRTVMNA